MSRPIKDLLSTFMQPSDNWQVHLMQNWHTIFGTMSNHVTCEKIERDTIVLGVYDSCWMQELYLLTPTLLHAINTHCGAYKITHIRFKKVTRKSKKIPIPPTQTVVTMPTKVLSSAERATLARVTDSELQAALKNFLIRCHQTRQL